MDIAQNMTLVELDSFDTAAAVEPGRDAEAKRRFMTLLVDATGEDDSLRARVRRAQNTAGETFALKGLFPVVGPAAGVPADLGEDAVAALSSAFFEGYRNLLAVSQLKGFAQVYGYGLVGRVPVVVMEWVDGLSLLEAMPLLPRQEAGETGPAGVRADVVAALGEAVARVLAQTAGMSSTFAHRDISPRNIMLRTSERNLDEQVAAGAFDVCLVDLESSSIARPEQSTFTMRSNVWRNGTPEYAAPEMLTQDVPGVEALRHFPSVDVYALCNVLYELYAGRTPFDVAAQPLRSPYQIKAGASPAELLPRCDKDAGLVEAILAGIRPGQADRETMHELLDRLVAWREGRSYQPTAEPVRAMMTQPAEGTHLSMAPSCAAGDGIGAAERSEKRDEPQGGRRDGTGAADEKDALAAGHVPAGRTAAVTRRAAIGIGVVGALGMAAVAVATRGFGLLRPRELDDYDWDELAELADRIAAADSDEEGLKAARSVGLVGADGRLEEEHVKHFSLADGTAAEAQIVGFRADERADGQGKAGISFLMRTSVGARSMNDEPRLGGWEQSSLRQWMATELPALMPADLVAHVRPVLKVTNNVGAVDAGDPIELTKTEDAFWLVSMSELCGYQGPETFSEGYEYLSDLYSNEGAQYQLFHELAVSGLTTNEPIVRWAGGDKVFWWERTPSPDGSLGLDSTVFNRVMRDGDAFNGATPGDAPDEATHVMPGFCL